MPPDEQSDASGLASLRRHDPEALAAAVREHVRPLFRSARALGFSEDEAEDLVQDVFVTFLEKIDTFQGRSQLRTWLIGILHRKAMEQRRQQAADRRCDSLDSVLESRFDARGNWIKPPADLERLFESQRAGELIRGCMEKLPANQRAVFILREIQGLKTQEICKILEVTVTNMGVLFHRARTRLRECLENAGKGQQ
ncbi:MAG: RNA polymerase sigma factor [Bryobacteraceae bacterium]